MYPILIEWGSFILPAWHTFYVLGAFGAYFLFIHLAKKHFPEIPHTQLINLYLSCYIGGYFGARILSIFVDESEITGIADKLAALLQLGPMTFYGGFIGSFLCGTIYIVYKKMPASKILDMAILAGLVGLAVGRIGCFLNGDDYGKPYNLAEGETIPWWVVTFPNHEYAIPRYPVQLIATISVSILIATIYKYFNIIREKFGPGSVAVFSAGGYAILRFLNEYYRGDDRGWVIDQYISTSQFISISVFLVCTAFVIKRKLS